MIEAVAIGAGLGILYLAMIATIVVLAVLIRRE